MQSIIYVWIFIFDTIADLPETEEEQLWQAVYDARQSYYEENIGSMPDYLLKMNDMSGVWPGGGIVNIKADKLGKDLWVYSTFGLSNADMPTKVVVEGYQAETDELGRVTKSTAMLKRKETVNTGSGGAGYGYEMLLITRENAEQPLEKNQWPLWFMQWVVHAEINNDAGFLNRVEKHDGYTSGK